MLARTRSTARLRSPTEGDLVPQATTCCPARRHRIPCIPGQEARENVDLSTLSGPPSLCAICSGCCGLGGRCGTSSPARKCLGHPVVCPEHACNQGRDVEVNIKPRPIQVETVSFDLHVRQIAGSASCKSTTSRPRASGEESFPSIGLESSWRVRMEPGIPLCMGCVCPLGPTSSWPFLFGLSQQEHTHPGIIRQFYASPPVLGCIFYVPCGWCHYGRR